MGKKENNLKMFSRSEIHKALYNLLNETLNESLPYDNDAQKQFTKEEFNELLNDYRLYGNLFGLLFITKIMDRLDSMVEEFKEKEN